MTDARVFRVVNEYGEEVTTFVVPAHDVSGHRVMPPPAAPRATLLQTYEISMEMMRVISDLHKILRDIREIQMAGAKPTGMELVGYEATVTRFLELEL